MLDDVPSGIKRCVVIEEAYPERGQGADAAPRAAIRAAHLKKALEAHFRESGGEMIGPVALSRQFAREGRRSEEHTSELQSLMRISYAVFCLKKKKITQHTKTSK